MFSQSQAWMLNDNTFTISGMGEKRTILLRHDARKLVAASIVAVADGLGLGFANSLAFETTGNARRDMPEAFVATLKKMFGDQQPILKLEQDDVPIRGRIVDLEGRGVAVANVQLREIWATKQRDLSAWEKAARSPNIEFQSLQQAGLTLNMWAGPTLTFAPAVKTDADGRFELRGVGRERIAGLIVSGPHIESFTPAPAKARRLLFHTIGNAKRFNDRSRAE